MIEELLPLIGTYGFPIFVSVWFMYRLEKKMDENTKAFIELTDNIKKWCIK